MNDVLDGVLDSASDEEEADNVLNMVLEDIGAFRPAFGAFSLL